MRASCVGTWYSAGTAKFAGVRLPTQEESQMLIERLPVNRMLLQDFADKHGLIMEIGERTQTDLHPSIPFKSNRFYASFKDIETKQGACLCGTHGNGGTGEEAISDYANQISGKLLVRGAFTEDRQEFYAPELYYATDGGGEHG
jgi:hypothetical protein